MKREMSYVQTGLSVASLILWFLLPVFSFIVVIPLFNISGWNLVFRINQLTLFALFGGLLMLVAAVINNRKLMIVSSAFEIVCIILMFVFRKNLILGGNFKWIYTSATLLIQRVPELVGVDTSSWDIQQVVQYVVDNFLQFGIGGILHAFCTLVYLIVAICASEAKNDNKKRNDPVSERVNTFNVKTTHQNTGFTHRT